MLKGYRTILFNLVFGVPLLIELVLSVIMTSEFGQLVPDKYMPIYTMTVLLGNLWLRLKTDTAVGRPN